MSNGREVSSCLNICETSVNDGGESGTPTFVPKIMA
jgi:hypothetical protein